MTGRPVDVSSWVLGALASIHETHWALETMEWLFHPFGGATRTVSAGYELLDQGAYAAPDYLCPIAVVDAASVACVVLWDDPERNAWEGTVVRWFLSDVDVEQQLRLLDTDPVSYVESVETELAHRDAGLKRILDQVGPAFRDAYVANERRPRGHIVRPIRIACQNVIVALGAISQDSSFAGLSVVAWQTCEVPHVATHEANRALAALTLCDAFQNGGTMEIRFDRPATVHSGSDKFSYDGHPELAVPASLRRYARTVGVALGRDSPGSVSPAEARELFLAVTPMPLGLRSRVEVAVNSVGISPERICFTLLSQIWREIELDMILATSTRAAPILEGGSAWTHRLNRSAEMETARAALMLGMFYRRLNASSGKERQSDEHVVEDLTNGVQWDIEDSTGLIRMSGLPAQPLPWLTGQTQPSPPEVDVFLSSIDSAEVATAASTRAAHSPTAVVVPRDLHFTHDLGDAHLLRCPDRTADLDAAIEGKLLSARISRG